jgi:hypothetical protein
MLARRIACTTAATLFLTWPAAHAQTAVPGAYPSVNDAPPKRDAPVMTSDERAKLKKDLSAARDRQTGAVKARDKTGR